MTPAWRNVALFPLMLLLCSVGLRAQAAASAANPAPSAQESKAAAADLAWLALVDDGKYGDSWKAASPFFQSAITQESWESALGPTRTALGKLVSRKAVSAKRKTSLPGAPDGEYIVTVFSSSFEHKESAQETVTATHEKDGTWRVSGYFIK